MPYTAIQFETDGPVATITMDRPEKRNALNHALLDDLLHALNVVADDDALKVAILRANGPAFSAGYDIDGSPYINPPDGGLSGTSSTATSTSGSCAASTKRSGTTPR